MAHDDAGSSPAGEGRRSAFPVLSARAPGAPAPVPAGSRRPSAGPPPPSRVPAVLGATGAGVAAAVFGTLLHAQLFYLGGTALPVGALAALVLARSLFLLSGLWARSIILTAVAGAVAYGVVALLSTSSKTLILTGASDAAPGTALAGNLWLFGVLVVTLAAVVLGSVLLRPARR